GEWRKNWWWFAAGFGVWRGFVTEKGERRSGSPRFFDQPWLFAGVHVKNRGVWATGSRLSEKRCGNEGEGKIWVWSPVEFVALWWLFWRR
ncbi:hypothetical protein HAX54_050987, partial [Datura stramonium]|nr:hypothetical protein [Datura stramonium]